MVWRTKGNISSYRGLKNTYKGQILTSNKLQNESGAKFGVHVRRMRYSGNYE